MNLEELVQSQRRARALNPLIINRLAAGRDEALNRYVESQIPETPYIIRVIPGVVTKLAVDPDGKATGLCTVDIGGGQLIDSVDCADGEPRIGARYGVRRDTAGRHWIKRWGESVQHWLYEKDQNQTIMRRYGWPPPVDSKRWVVEEVHTAMDPPLFLVGGATPPAPGKTEVFLGRPTTVPPYRGDGAIYTTPSTFAIEYVPFSDMGFGNQGTSFFMNPAYLEFWAIAPDGEWTIAEHQTLMPLETPGSQSPFGNRVVDTVQTCCLPFPIEGTDLGEFCAGITNYRWEVGLGPVGPVVQLDYFLHNNYDLGRLGTANTAHALTGPAPPVLVPHTLPGTVHGETHSHGDGCHWTYLGPFPIAVVWDSVTTEAHAYREPDGIRYSVTTHRFPAQFVLNAGTWNPNNERAWAVVIVEQIDDHTATAIVQSDRVNVSGTSMPVIPGSPTGISYPNAVFLCLRDDQRLVIYGQDGGDNGYWYRWRAGDGSTSWEQLIALSEPVTRVFAAGGDSLDLYAEIESGVRVGSIDGGATWVKLPELPAPLTGYPSRTSVFVRQYQ